MNRRRGQGFGALLLAIGVIAAACTPTAQPSATATPATAASGQPKAGGTLNVWLTGKPSLFSPIAAAIESNTMVMQLIYGRLVELNEKNEVVPELAERWEVSPDATKFTFHLRKGVKWSDGASFTCKDALFTFKARMDPRTGSPVGLPEVKGAADFKDGKTTAPAGLQCVDDATFQIELDLGNAALLAGNIASNPTAWFIMPEHILGAVDPNALGKHAFFLNPTVGTGPFTFVRYETDQFVELKRNPNYWQAPKPYLERVFFKLVTQDVAGAQLEKGEMQLARVTADNAERLSKVPGVSVQSAPGTGPTIFTVPQEKPEWKDKRIRQALMHAIDREALIKQIAKGYGSITNTHLLGPAWALETSLKTYPYDPEKAKSLLKEAGYDVNRTNKLQWTPGADPIRDQIVPLLQGYLAAVGVKTELNPLQPAPHLDNIAKNTYDLVLYGGGNYVADPEAVAVTVSCAGWYPKGANIPHYCNPRVDELFVAGRATSDQAKRAPIYKEISRIINDEVPWVWVMVPDTIYAASKKLGGFKVVGNSTWNFWNAESWWLE